MNKRIILIIVLCLIAAGGLAYYFVHKNSANNIPNALDENQIISKVAEGEIETRYVAISGTVNDSSGKPANGKIIFGDYQAAVKDGKFSIAEIPADLYSISFLDTSGQPYVLDRQSVEALSDTNLDLKISY
ncbi:MAG: hypothetical protein NTZ65_04150 [Candidatus Berkelbacteria bacterium]|nr:hypothetical protein [Candidatus Berkelbacteria bacterium]